MQTEPGVPSRREETSTLLRIGLPLTAAYVAEMGMFITDMMIVGRLGSGTGGCDQDKCDQMHCEADLSSHVGGICLEVSYNDKFFYPSVSEYCEEKRGQNDDEYQLGTTLPCEPNCDVHNCCVLRCLEEDYLTIKTTRS